MNSARQYVARWEICVFGTLGVSAVKCDACVACDALNLSASRMRFQNIFSAIITNLGRRVPRGECPCQPKLDVSTATETRLEEP